MSCETPATKLGTHISLKLINLVKDHPVMYLPSKSSPNRRKNRNEINRVWQVISAEVGLSAEDCKRRWKGLKDVYSKLRRRRLQENVLGISARRKWLYEDAMDFLKFSFERSYEEALEAFEDVDCDDWKLEYAECSDAGELYCNDGHEQAESNDEKSKEQSQTDKKGKHMTMECMDLELHADSISSKEEQDSEQSSEQDNGAWSSGLDNELPLQPSLVEKNTKLQTRCRAIRQLNTLNNGRNLRSRNATPKTSTTSTPSIVSVSSLNPMNQIIVESPKLQSDKNCDTVILTSSNMKVNNYPKMESVDVRVASPSQEQKQDCKNVKIEMDASLKSKKSLRPQVFPKRGRTSSVELFFESMAHTVMNLPMRAQAEIKMEICKLVTRAEIKYSQVPNPKLGSRKSKSKQR
ncbi:uncharacterized protein LOC124412432 [Diprion similis]|uniref:uncharacterized protein LOC124412432 n=1 Tax=Diprion similis TaxID=362088 RepID=UPI001EF8BE46|nr:uncharacterized protein LOC124412432 [Diprion similis]